ncbi:MAG TPA: cytochrome C oxidase Cbb3, partial [Chromatiales bacterium]|nr:cytochrome C oxidase Cbb3 [Chromatiales bacterium]
LGWNALVTFGSMYFLIPRLFGREVYSLRLVEWHFWLATIGIVLYITSMWVSGIMQGLMWRAVNPDGTLTYSFVESVQAMHPFYVTRFLGGAIFLLGLFVMAYNMWKTVAAGQSVEARIPEPAAAH